ncbi:MAG: hypothetical protein ACRD43_13950 [Pyrinomonadaceae bacterium]
MDWLNDLWMSLTPGKVLLGIGLFVLSFAVSLISIAVVMVKIPADYFSSHYQRDFLPDSPWHVRWGAIAIKNALGVLLVLLGILLSLPGVPGQGILTILLGLIMLDIPGMRPLEARIIQRPAVLGTINRFRARYERPPLQVD